MHTTAELGHELSTPLNVLLGRLTLLEEAEGVEEARGHGAAMRRQIDKLVVALGTARAQLPDPVAASTAVSQLVERLTASLALDVELRIDPTTRVVADPEEAVLAVLALCDHLGGEVTIELERRDLQDAPARHFAPGDYVCVVVTKNETATEPDSEAVWALLSARGHARLTRAAVVTPSASEAALVLQPSG